MTEFDRKFDFFECSELIQSTVHDLSGNEAMAEVLGRIAFIPWNGSYKEFNTLYKFDEGHKDFFGETLNVEGEEDESENIITTIKSYEDNTYKVLIYCDNLVDDEITERTVRACVIDCLSSIIVDERNDNQEEGDITLNPTQMGLASKILGAYILEPMYCGAHIGRILSIHDSTIRGYMEAYKLTDEDFIVARTFVEFMCLEDSD